MRQTAPVFGLLRAFLLTESQAPSLKSFRDTLYSRSQAPLGNANVAKLSLAATAHNRWGDSTTMRSRYRIVEGDGIYFLTCTIVHWIPVFEVTPIFWTGAK